MVENFKTLFIVKSSLISLYLALTIPIPFFSDEKLKILSIFAFSVGLFLIINITNDQVITCGEGITYKTTQNQRMKTNLTVLRESFIIWVSNSMGGTEHTQHTFDSLTAVSQSRE